MHELIETALTAADACPGTWVAGAASVIVVAAVAGGCLVLAGSAAAVACHATLTYLERKGVGRGGE